MLSAKKDGHLGLKGDTRPCLVTPMSNPRILQVLTRRGTGRRYPLPRLSRVVFWCLGGTSAVLAHASEIHPMPSWPQLETRLSVSREALDTRWSAVARPPSSAPDYSVGSARPWAAWGGIGNVPALIEISPEHVGATDLRAFIRPQLALGGSSDSLRSWLQFVGINAGHCMAPLMKMHSSFADSTSHANVSVSARCSIR